MLHHRCILNLYVGSTEIFQFLKKMSISQYFSKNHHNLHYEKRFGKREKKSVVYYLFFTDLHTIDTPSFYVHIIPNFFPNFLANFLSC